MGKAQVMGIAGLPATDQARLPGYKAHMFAIANAPRLWVGQNLLVRGIRMFLNSLVPIKFVSKPRGCADSLT